MTAEREAAEVLATHRVYGFTGSDIACRCDRTWRTTKGYETHLAAALAAAAGTTREAEAVWVSSCSMHGHVDPECDRCQGGHWVSRAEMEASQAEFAADPDAWREKANRRVETTDD